MTPPKVYSAYEYVRDAGAPREMFTHLTLTAYRVSNTGKIHDHARCYWLRSGSRARRVSIPAVGIKSEGLCQCMSAGAPGHFAAILGPASAIAGMAVCAGSLRNQLADGRTPDLSEVEMLRQAVTGAEDATRELTSALLAAVDQDGTAPAADLLAVEADMANTWATATTREASEVLKAVLDVTARNPDRDLVEAAALLAGKLAQIFKSWQSPCLAASDGKTPHVLNLAQEILDARLPVPGCDVDRVRADVLALVDDQQPKDVSQLPDVPVPAGMTLLQAVTELWREGARAELAGLVDGVLTRYRRMLDETSPSVLITAGVPDGAAVGLLGRYRWSALGAGERVYVVPTVIGRAVESLSGSFEVRVAAAPLPQGHPVPTDAAGMVKLAAGPYVRTLRALVEEMVREHAIAAALGIVAGRDTAA